MIEMEVVGVSRHVALYAIIIAKGDHDGLTIARIMGPVIRNEYGQ